LLIDYLMIAYCRGGKQRTALVTGANAAIGLGRRAVFFSDRREVDGEAAAPRY